MSNSSSFNSRFKTNTYLNEYIHSNPSQGDDQMNMLNPSAQISHVVNDIQNLNIKPSSSNYHYSTQRSVADRLNVAGGGMKGVGGGDHLNKKLLDTLSKDSGVQSNGDVDSGIYKIISPSRITYK